MYNPCHTPDPPGIVSVATFLSAFGSPGSSPRAVLPFWAFLERVERLPMGTEKGARPGPRERRLASVRNTVGAVASFQRVSTPRGRARAWIRQCLVSKCLEACVAALLAETRLVQVFTGRFVRRIRKIRQGVNTALR